LITNIVRHFQESKLSWIFIL